MAPVSVIKHVCIAAVIAGCLTTARPATALDEVIDHSAIAKLADQLTILRKQLDTMTDELAVARQQANAIGRMGQISIPMVNLARVASRLRQDAQCLAPDMDRLMPGLNLDDQGWGSICQASIGYRGALWLDPRKMKGLPWEKQEEVRRAVETRRTNVAVDVASKGMAQGDMAARGGEDMNKVAADLEAAVNAATNQNEWLAAIAQGQVVNARAQVQQTQLLAQILKVQSTWMALTALPPQSILATEEQGGSPQ